MRGSEIPAASGGKLAGAGGFLPPYWQKSVQSRVREAPGELQSLMASTGKALSAFATDKPK
jgi:hypothetical protein